MKQVKLFFLFSLFITSVFSQTSVLKDNGSWFSLSNKFQVSKNISITNVTQMRRVYFLKNIEATIIQPGINYEINKNISLGAGYLHFTYFTNGVAHSPIKKYENRFWQSITVNSGLGSSKLSQRFVFEERFKDNVVLNSDNQYIIDGVYYAQRFRYRLEVTTNLIKLKNDKIIYGKLSNETRIRFETGLTEPDFDQNNFAALIGYQLVDNSKIWVGYGRYYYKSSPTKFISNDILHINLSYDFDFTKNKL